VSTNWRGEPTRVEACEVTKERLRSTSVARLLDLQRDIDLDIRDEEAALRRCGYAGSNCRVNLLNWRRKVKVELESRLKELEACSPS
jgi:hypothetical protein